MIFETHAHYDDPAYDLDREELLASMKENGIDRIINASASMEECRITMEYIEKYPFMYGMLGVHPSEVENLTEEDMQWIFDNSSHDKIVAIGEIGLDYHYEEPSSDIQKKWFIRQLELARDAKLPLNIHSRDAAKETFDIMVAHHAEDMGGVIHCYSYSPEMAVEYTKMGFVIGVGGVVTFKNAKKLKETVDRLSLSDIVLETDSPYLSPVPFRGERNSSLNLHYVVSEIAAIKGVEPKEVERVTYENACRVYSKVNSAIK